MKNEHKNALNQSAANCNCGKKLVTERRECTNQQRLHESDGLFISCVGCNGKGDSPWCYYCPKENEPRL